MRLHLIAVGRPRGPVAVAIEEYERRLRHYFTYQVVEVREEPGRRGTTPAHVREEEGKRMLARVPAGAELLVLDRTGRGLSSMQLSRLLSPEAGTGGDAVAFMIGGAFGLSEEVLSRANRRLSLSTFTLPHELARLMLVEQLYRAGTIARSEPYHKGREEA